LARGCQQIFRRHSGSPVRGLLLLTPGGWVAARNHSQITFDSGAGREYGQAMRPRLVSYIENHKARLEQRHYVTAAFSDTLWFYFLEFKVRAFVDAYGLEFCLVVHGSPLFDHAFILPFKDFKDFFTPDLLDQNQRWVCNIPAPGQVIKLSCFERSKERPVGEYHNAFHRLQDVPAYDRPAPDMESLI
jgi:hypothetical protein